jgi:hypothetical protein
MKVRIQLSKHKTYKIKYYVDITKILKEIFIIIRILHYFLTLKAAVCSETSVSTNKTTRYCSAYDYSAIYNQFAIWFAVPLLFALYFDCAIRL